jgi:hypothetical protein
MKKASSSACLTMIIDDCDCEQLRNDFIALRTEYQEHHERAYDGYLIGIEEAIKTDPKNFFLGTLISRKSGWVIHRS